MIELNRIYNEDCLETMSRMDDKSVDLVLTDPPYGVDFGYDVHKDARETFSEWILPIVDEMLRVGRTVAFTPGITNLFIYPKPKWTCCYFKPGSTRRNGTGGFNEWEPILVYGEPGRIMTDAKRFPDCVNHVKGKIDHPCPKPINAFRWLIQMLDGCPIYDPFLGSGTTAIACIKEGRQWIGSEISPKYCEIAQKRIDQELAQTDLFRESSGLSG